MFTMQKSTETRYQFPSIRYPFNHLVPSKRMRSIGMWAGIMPIGQRLPKEFDVDQESRDSDMDVEMMSLDECFELVDDASGEVWVL